MITEYTGGEREKQPLFFDLLYTRFRGEVEAFWIIFLLIPCSGIAELGLVLFRPLGICLRQGQVRAVAQ
jgi:hypothetical protein